MFLVVSALPIRPMLGLVGRWIFARDLGVGRSGTDPAESRGCSGSARRGEGINLGAKLYVGNLSFSTTEDELR